MDRKKLIKARKNIDKVDNKIFSQPNIIVHRGRLITFLSHTKRYIQSIIKIIIGDKAKTNQI